MEPTATTEPATTTSSAATKEPATVAGPAATTGQAAYPDNFEEMVRKEIRFIEKRTEGRKIDLKGVGPGAPPLAVAALSLSGGGIRSASFCLGVTQAFNEHGIFSRFDYLSTVSGGGYLGASISATMNKSETGEFVFGESTRSKDPDTAAPSDVKDTDSVAHLRNYSNYLIPRGGRDVVTAVAIILRGLIANAALTLPFILLAAILVIATNPTRSSLRTPDFFGYNLDWLVPVNNFGITLAVALIVTILFLIWAVRRSSPGAKQSEFASWPPVFGVSCLFFIAMAFFCELQPYALEGMFELSERTTAAGSSEALLTSAIHGLAAIATPIAAVVTFFRQQIGTLFKSVTSSSAISTKAAALLSEAAIWIAGAAVPLLIWIGFLYLCYWAIENTGPSPRPRPASPPPIHGTMQIDGPGIKFSGSLDCRQSASTSGANSPCSDRPDEVSPIPEPYGHTPSWLLGAAKLPNYLIGQAAVGKTAPTWGIAVLYFAFGALLFLISYKLTPNANSLHRLYRDRLSKAFLFDPSKAKTQRKRFDDMDQGRDFEPLDTLQLSDLVKDKLKGPYQLINAALNIQGSDYANRRGRNADFFLFSPAYIGSVATTYCKTEKMELDTGLDLATAMGVSGAAFSSNMGANSIKALTATLALLNVRTGYWLKNPKALSQPGKRLTSNRWYLLNEITGRLTENSEDVYLTDGGHIENLGIYELLRRRCKVIVAVDAEADPAMRFPSFLALQRYARIDLGVRIWMPWDKIRSRTITNMGDGGSAESPTIEEAGPHAAIGRIEYDGGQEGWLLYIKSSLSGDENDYVRDYGRRYTAFPHETTGDQFFSEEQFEAYRALGFHIAIRLLRGQDRMQVYGTERLLTINAENPAVKAVREALMDGVL